MNLDLLQMIGLLASILIGFSLGIIGGGGSMLTLPVMVYLLGINPVMSTAYSLFVVGTTSLVGSFSYIQKRLIAYRVALFFSIPSFLAVLLTRTYIISFLPDPVFQSGAFRLGKDRALMLLFALIMLAAAVSMLRSKQAEQAGEVPSQLNYPRIVVGGALVGILTGTVGVGGGFLIIPALVLLTRLPMNVAVGTSLLIIATKSLIGFLGDLATLQLDWFFLLGFTSFSLIGICLGSYLGQFIPGQILKKAFGWLILGMSLYIFFEEVVLSPPSVGPSRQEQRDATDKLRSVTDRLRAASGKADTALLQYGKALIAHTAYYLGPAGKVAHLSNGMNCQNCHLEAGTKRWGNNYGAVASTYPKFRERSGSTETVVKRISDCFERSLNGKAPDSTSREMQAMVIYLKYIGRNVPKGKIPEGTGIWPLAYLNRAASPEKGKVIYGQKCVSCHGKHGEGLAKPDDSGYIYPPLWGKHSYNTGAGLYRISRLAGFLKTNMPLGATWEKPQLTDAQAWDLAAYLNSQPRPHKDFLHDWPDLKGKPVDHPFGPYADPFSEKQHKYGPFQPIVQFRKAQFRKQAVKSVMPERY